MPEKMLTALDETPPSLSYDAAFTFLVDLKRWLEGTRDRLTCSALTGRHAVAMEVLSSDYASSYGALDRALGGSSTVERGATSSALSVVAVKLTVLLLLQFLFVVLMWCVLIRSVLTASIPRLRARILAGHLRRRAWATSAEVARKVDQLIRPDKTQRHLKESSLWAAGVSGAVGCFLILALLTMHLWANELLWSLLRLSFTPLLEARTWLGAVLPHRVRLAGTDSFSVVRAQVEQQAPSLLLLGSYWKSQVSGRVELLRILLHRLMTMYLWDFMGSSLLGVAMWLLYYSSRIFRTYNRILPYYGRDTRLLRGQEEIEADARRRDRERVQEMGRTPIVPAVVSEGGGAAIEDGTSEGAAAAEALHSSVPVVVSTAQDLATMGSCAPPVDVEAPLPRNLFTTFDEAAAATAAMPPAADGGEGAMQVTTAAADAK